MHPLLDQYPDNLVSVTTFGREHPEILSPRRAYGFIDQINNGAPAESIRRIFRKRFGRWFVHVPSLVEYLESEDPLLECSAAEA